MDNNRLGSQGLTWPTIIVHFIAGVFCGLAVAAALYWTTQIKGVWEFLLPGALLGGVIGLCWQTFMALWTRLRSDEWQVTEIEIETLGQKWKLANSGSQRRVAWVISVELSL